ncbi:HAD-IA family hydrolase [Hyphococcus aureus]|uniref:HAD-IA family hydrolase n=1 Tax=Hyphococcus aureus TaxID=2666033 RepID=A0ABW1KR35_9PROT
MVDYRGPERLAALSNGRLSLAEARTALSQTPALHAFERGELTPLAFAEQAVQQWELDVSPGDFIADFETWPERFLPGARDAINALEGKYRLACFSNINIPHWRQAETLGLAQLFEKTFLSHELGARKPEQRAYDLVINSLDAPPAGVLFFDDVAENVAAAREAGVQAQHVDAGRGLLSALSDAGVI